MSRISLVQLAGSVRKFNLNRPFICPILRLADVYSIAYVVAGEVSNRGVLTDY